MIAAADVRHSDPIVFLLGKREVLHLTDEQTTSLERIEASMAMELAPSYGQLDSIRALVPARDPGDRGRMSDAEREKLRPVFEAYGERRRAIGERYGTAADSALAQLNEEQRTQATTMLEEQRAEVGRMMGPRGRRPAGAGGRGEGGPPR